MIKKRWLTYPCYSGAEKRRLYVYLPRGYNSSGEQRYPVLYMFDGQNVFFDDNATYGKSWQVGKYLDRMRTQLIVVAYECNAHADNGRLSEYSPFDCNWPDDWGGPHEGRGEETMQWFIDVLKPYVDERYRTLPDREHTFICGSSMGGLMSLYAVLAHNDVFSRAAALSPSLGVDAEALARLVDEADIGPDTMVYMDYGEKELTHKPWSEGNFSRFCGKLLERNVLLTARVVPDGKHNEESWEKQLPFVIPALMYNISNQV